MTTNEKECDGTPETTQAQISTDKKTEALRMWSAISFALIILGLGIPLWWKTTEVYRVALPYAEIDDLQNIEPRVLVNVSIYTEFPSRTNKRIEQLTKALAPSRLFEVRFSPFKLDIGKGIVSDLEELDYNRNSKPGNLYIIETDVLPKDSVVLGNYKSMYVHSGVKSEIIIDVIKQWVLREDYLNDMLGSLEYPGSRSGQERRLKSEPCFDIVFTTVNPEPDQVKTSFNSEGVMVKLIEPLLNQLKSAVDLKVKSQWLYFVDIGLEPKKNSQTGDFVIASDKIPHIISPLEKKLGSGVSSCPCLHFVLYIPKCSEIPMYFASKEGNLEIAVVSPKWGGIQIHNPSAENCVNKTTMIPDMGVASKIFVSHLRYLLDFRFNPIPGAKQLTLSKSPLRGWEVDSLFRTRVLEQAISARLTLQSLSRLLGEISNIVINEEVGDAIKTSVVNISAAFASLSYGDLDVALVHARKAFVTAEMAFGHPSLLALLYFPDDQKYAVYIPLFLPVMIPVVLSLKNIWKWLKNKPEPDQVESDKDK